MDYPAEETPEAYNPNTDTWQKLKHREGRYIKDKRPEQNRELPNVKDILKNDGRVSYVHVCEPYGRSRKQWAKWLGIRQKGGSTGKVFFSKMSPQLSALKQNARFQAGGRLPNVGTDIVIKIVPAPYSKYVNNKVTDAVREASWSQHLSSLQHCYKVPECTKPLCVYKLVPKFYWHGMVFDALTKKRMFFFVMSKAAGQPVDSISRNITAAEYVKIERAVAALWWAGVAHSDMHLKNIFLSPEQATVIDFGFATLLPNKVRNSVQTNIPKAIRSNVRSLADVWKSPTESNVGADVMAFVNRVQYTRRPHKKAWYNPDAYMLTRLYSRVQNKEDIPTERRKLWGFKEGQRAFIGPLPKGWYELNKPVAKKPRKVPGGQRAESDRLLNSQFLPPDMRRAIKKITRSARPGKDTNDKDAKGRTIYEGPSGARYVLAQGHRRRPARGRPDPIDSGKKNAKDRIIWKGPRGGKYILINGKRRPPARGRRPQT